MPCIRQVTYCKVVADEGTFSRTGRRQTKVLMSGSIRRCFLIRSCGDKYVKRPLSCVLLLLSCKYREAHLESVIPSVTHTRWSRSTRCCKAIPQWTTVLLPLRPEGNGVSILEYTVSGRKAANCSKEFSKPQFGRAPSQGEVPTKAAVMVRIQSQSRLVRLSRQTIG
jgi:hypothetical protein